MPNNFITDILVSGNSYDFKDKNAASVSSVTQNEYDNLPSSAKTSGTMFIITDAQPIDVSQYWTSGETQSAITQATSGKADSSAVTQEITAAVSGKVDSSSVVSSVTSASTDSEIPTAKAVYDAIPTVPTSASQLTNDIGYITSGDAQTQIDNSISGKADSSSLATVATSGSYNDLTNKPTIPTSTSAVTSGSTDVITSGGVYQQMGGLKLVKLTQSAYDALSPNYDSNTIYFIKD